MFEHRNISEFRHGCRIGRGINTFIRLLLSPVIQQNSLSASGLSHTVLVSSADRSSLELTKLWHPRHQPATNGTCWTLGSTNGHFRHTNQSMIRFRTSRVSVEWATLRVADPRHNLFHAKIWNLSPVELTAAPQIIILGLSPGERKEMWIPHKTIQNLYSTVAQTSHSHLHDSLRHEFGNFGSPINFLLSSCDFLNWLYHYDRKFTDSGMVTEWPINFLSSSRDF